MTYCKLLASSCLLFLLVMAACNDRFQVKGTVVGKYNGPDGYTATIATAQGDTVMVVASAVDRPSAFVVVEIGQHIKASSNDTFHLGGRIVFTAASIDILH
jgi:hypothetical protein